MNKKVIFGIAVVVIVIIIVAILLTKKPVNVVKEEQEEQEVIKANRISPGGVVTVPEGAKEVAPGVYYIGNATVDGEEVKGYMIIH